ncbi:hypothetical protein [Pengzhenrongella sicca]|uniref:Uncharacterized protein n=1 Tax=Pengzhenrongella sicca TaxID=2819238 RepID=A0A8A4ZF31_9MICO|nr:hypothetical protein [Pengzhenrongella sicca]QTE29619.1 hypothetical protein J4E96_00680 [Pengzhenrongella sicca]
MDASPARPAGPPRARPAEPTAYRGTDPAPRTWRQRVAGWVPGLLGAAAGVGAAIAWPDQPWPVRTAYLLGVALVYAALAFGWRRLRRSPRA